MSKNHLKDHLTSTSEVRPMIMLWELPLKIMLAFTTSKWCFSKIWFSLVTRMDSSQSYKLTSIIHTTLIRMYAQIMTIWFKDCQKMYQWEEAHRAANKKIFRISNKRREDQAISVTSLDTVPKEHKQLIATVQGI